MVILAPTIYMLMRLTCPEIITSDRLKLAMSPALTCQAQAAEVSKAPQHWSQGRSGVPARLQNFPPAIEEAFLVKATRYYLSFASARRAAGHQQHMLP